MNPRGPILALAADLKRICLGIYRDSPAASRRFAQEAELRIKEIPPQSTKPYIERILGDLATEVLPKPDSLEKAEECLTYSVLLRNYGLTTPQ